MKELTFICLFGSIFVVQLPSCGRVFATPWTVARQASLSLTISWSLPNTELAFPRALLFRMCLGVLGDLIPNQVGSTCPWRVLYS